MPGSMLFSIGEAWIEMLPSQTGCALAEVPAFCPQVGGAPVRVCEAFARLGGQSALLSQLGSDPFGHRIAQELDACGVDISHLAFTDRAGTALAFYSIAADGTRHASFFRKPSADLLYAPEQLDPAWFREAFALHFSSAALVDSPMRYAHLAAIDAAREAGALVSFAPALCPDLWSDRDALRQTVLQFAPLAHLRLLTDEELPFLTGSQDPESALPQLLIGNVRLVLYLRSGRGAWACTRSAQTFAACREPDAADSSCFLAAFLFQLVRDGIPAEKLGTLSRTRLHGLLTSAFRADGTDAALPAAEALAE